MWQDLSFFPFFSSCHLKMSKNKINVKQLVLYCLVTSTILSGKFTPLNLLKENVMDLQLLFPGVKLWTPPSIVTQSNHRRTGTFGLWGAVKIFKTEEGGCSHPPTPRPAGLYVYECNSQLFLLCSHKSSPKTSNKYQQDVLLYSRISCQGWCPENHFFCLPVLAISLM